MQKKSNRMFTYCCLQRTHDGRQSDTCGRTSGNIPSTCRHASCPVAQELGTWPSGTPLFSSPAPLQTLTQPGRSQLLHAGTSDWNSTQSSS